MGRIVDSRCVLAVRNLASSTRYWTEVLGFALEPVDAPGWSFLARDRDGLHAELEARGAGITSRPSDKPSGLREFTLRTPDGHRITFGELLSGSSVEGS